MELLCPSCQRKLTIPDHFAGQMAKCPMCNNTFTAPELPATPAAAFEPAPFPPTPPAAPVVTPAPDISPTPPALPAPLLSPPPAVTPAPGPVDGHRRASPPPPLPGLVPGEIAPPAVSMPLPAAPAAGAPAPTPGDYAHRLSVHVNPHVLQWLAVVAVLTVFLLSFFPWVGRYPGGVPFVTQSAWQAAFGAESGPDEEAKKLEKKLPAAMRPAGGGANEVSPGANGPMIVYVLLLVPALLLTVAAAVWQLLPLPGALQRLRPWRWAFVAGVALLALVLLVLQEVSGFKLENRVTTEADSAEKKAATGGASPAETRRLALDRGLRLSQLHRTAALGWATGLNALAVVCAVLVFWAERRGARPLPRVDVLW
jgi:hypothetical protein